MTIGATRNPCFKAYDIRGRIPDELNEAVARDIGRAYAALRSPRKVVVGHDVRESSVSLSAALCDGLMSMGADVVDIGLCGTETVYFGASHLEGHGVDGGIMVTASHNPSDYNGMKLVGHGARPISGDTGLREIEALVASGRMAGGLRRGRREELDLTPVYVDFLLGQIDVARLRPMRVVADAGNGCAGPLLEALARRMPIEFVRVRCEPDGSFPHGVPNPLLERNRGFTREAVLESRADLGIAWDGDFDRCFFFDERGGFVEGYYMVGLFAVELLAERPGSKIVYEPRLTWNTLEMVEQAGGIPVLSRTGHAFIKDSMRKADALYGGEMSAHHYFRDFAYCDSGMLPWLYLCQMLSRTGRTLSELVGERQRRFPCSGELNHSIRDPRAALEAVRRRYEPTALRVDRTDGYAFEFEHWRFNLRTSNTEPLVRLNVESRGDEPLMREKTEELTALLGEMA